MKVVVIGSGGREHAICYSLSNSRKVSKIYCIPGNAGTQSIAENIDIDFNNFKNLENFIKLNKIDIVIVGPEKPLVDGIVDYLEKKKIKVFGPNTLASKLEGSKIFTKKICEKYKIPTAKFGIFKNAEQSEKFFENCNYPIVVKADGLASGKGVYICEDKINALKAVNEIFKGKFGKTNEVLIEEFLDGEEMSFFIISDGKNFKKFNTAQDHKRVGVGDTGKNTGGMGAYTPSGLINQELENKIINKIINPTLKALNDINEEYIGFLYAGLMIKDNEPYLIEYNVRMGDPECQTILPLLKSDFLEIILACCDGKLDEIDIQWSDKKSLCVVLCSKGYPDTYEKNIEISGLNKLNLENDSFIFHAGTTIKNDKTIVNGGRVLNFVTISDNYLTSRSTIIDKIEKLNWSGGFYRSDIGFKIIK